ncbi:MAG: polyketide cyclase [Chloroflexota bacterium]|nr:polyketide cyclase [Chloroflexota bacterium]
MAASDYVFRSTWRVRGTLDEVRSIIADGGDYPRWWPSFCLAARELEPGDERGVGRRVEVWAKGWLPYTLRWTYRTLEPPAEDQARVEVRGELDGEGTWTFRQEGAEVVAELLWAVSARKRSIRALSRLLKPVFASNHYWCMRRGERSLQLELARRHASSDAERAAVPAPPGPAWPLRRPKVPA